jgi:hypothetical protein
MATNPHATIEELLEIMLSVQSMPRRYYKWDRLGASQLSVESPPMKRRLGGWCEMAASLGVSELRPEFCTVG